MKGVELYEWIEAALAMGKPKCDIHRKTLLKLVWIIDEDDELITWHIECPRPDCNREFRILVGFPYVSRGED